MSEKISNQYYFYKDEQQLGPYSWEQLWQEAAAKRVLAGTLVWNSEQTGWIAAEKIPGLIINTDFETINPPPPPVNTEPVITEQPKSAKSKALVIAITAAAIIVVTFGASLIYLTLAGDTPETAEPFFEFETVTDEDPLEPEQPENDFFASDEIFGWSVAELDDESFQSGTEATTDGNGPDGAADEEAASDSRTTEESTPADTTTETTPETDTAFPGSDTTEEETIPLLGGTYTGPLQDGLPHGQGYWTHPNGRSYRGSFREGRIEGFGTMIFPEGERYTGYLKDGKAHGEGTMTHPDGRTASGIWENGLPTEE